VTVPQVRKKIIPFGQHADNAIDYLAGILIDARVTTLKRVEGIGQEELDWRYGGTWNSIGSLLAHIVGGEHFFRIRMIEDRLLTDEEQTRWMPGAELGKHVDNLHGKSRDEYVAELHEAHEMTLAGLADVTWEQFTAIRDEAFPPDGYNLAWGLYHMAEDEVHHRGQISMIRKLYADLETGG
jgi:uncharacterized damage-inducible protein DinB